MQTDTLIPFVFARMPVRGAVVQLAASWQRMLRGHAYPPLLRDTLGHAAAASTLIAQSLKVDGHITLQISGDGPLTMLVMQCNAALDLRGMARAKADRIAGYRQLVAGANCAITVDGPAIERPYQGIVEASGDSLAASLEQYFARSVQVPSHLALVADEQTAAGLLLQQMPSKDAPAEDDWRRLGLLAATLRVSEVADGIDHDLLARLFAEDDLRVFKVRRTRFRCRCSKKRTEDVLRMLGAEEAEAALAAGGRVEVTCEYCGHRRDFDRAAIKRLFAAKGSTRLH